MAWEKSKCLLQWQNTRRETGRAALKWWLWHLCLCPELPLPCSSSIRDLPRLICGEKLSVKCAKSGRATRQDGLGGEMSFTEVTFIARRTISSSPHPQEKCQEEPQAPWYQNILQTTARFLLHKAINKSLAQNSSILRRNGMGRFCAQSYTFASLPRTKTSNSAGIFFFFFQAITAAFLCPSFSAFFPLRESKQVSM